MIKAIKIDEIKKMYIPSNFIINDIIESFF